MRDTRVVKAPNSTYGRILKTTTLLGGSSIICVILGIARTKILAVQLGPALFGVLGLYTSLATMIVGITSLGLGQSAVRDISAAVATGDDVHSAKTIRSFRRMIWSTALVGLITTLLVAYPASFWTFGDHRHVLGIAALSLLVFFTQLQAGQAALLQGLRRISDITGANISGALWGTIVAIPLVLVLRERGIVLFLICVSGGQLLTSYWYVRRVKVMPVAVGWSEALRHSHDMLRMGLMFVVSGASLAISMHLIRIIIQRQLGEVSVGLYQSALTISSMYVGFILQGMAGDYYPRLSAIAEHSEQRNSMVSEQAEMAILLATPGLVASLIFSEPLMSMLYSSSFLAASDVLRWHILGLLARIVAWPIGFILLARGDKAAFMLAEVTTSVLHVSFVFFGIRWFGIDGSGIAFCCMCWCNLVLVYWIVKRRHSYTWPVSSRNVILYGAAAVGVAFATTLLPSVFWRLGIGTIILAGAAAICLRAVTLRVGKERFVKVWQRVIAWWKPAAA